MKKEQKDRMCMMDDPIRSSGAVQSLREGWGVCHSRRKLTDWEKRRSGDTGRRGGIKSRVARFSNKITGSPVKFEVFTNEISA